MRKSKSEAAHGRDRDECFQEENSMSSPIAPTPIPGPTRSTAPSGVAARCGVSGAARPPAAVAAPISLDAIPSSPPQEVLDQMSAAGETYERLSAQGRELRFARDADSGRTTIEVRDRGGNVLKRLSPAEALELAAGAPLE
jgi:hypothetical protein